MRLRPRSLRFKVLIIVLAVLTLPQIFVWLSSLIESDVGDRMQKRTRTAALRARQLVANTGAAPDWAAMKPTVDALAADYGVRIRIASADGRLWIDSDEEAGVGLSHAVGDVFFGPDGAPTLAKFDQTLPALQLRDETLRALEHGEASACRHSPQRRLLTCHAVLRAGQFEGVGMFVYVQESSRRAIRSLYDLRFQLTKLTLFMLPVALLLAIAMGGWLVRPVEKLRRDVLKRARAGVPSPDIDIGGPDEIGDLSHAFNTLLGTLAERARTNEAFLADLAHEFKNPVAAIRAGAERLGDGSAVDTVRARRLSDIILRSCGRLDVMVTEFLELARAEGGLPNEEREPTALDALVRGIVSRIRPEVDTTGPTIELTTANEPITVPAVAHRLEMAVGNLIGNAVSFAGTDGTVHVAVDRHDGWARLRVTDSGPGISPEDLPRVFERFYTTRGERQGTGLGLALTKAIAEAHGGSVSVVSQPGRGAEFSLCLPFT